MPDTGRGSKDTDIWIMERIPDGWSKPANFGAPLNSELSEYFPSAANDGGIYFTRDNPEVPVLYFILRTVTECTLNRNYLTKK